MGIVLPGTKTGAEVPLTAAPVAGMVSGARLGVRGVPVFRVVEMAGVLDHISAVLTWRMDIGDEIEQVQILRQAANLSGALRICIGHHSLQFGSICLRQL